MNERIPYRKAAEDIAGETQKLTLEAVKEMARRLRERQEQEQSEPKAGAAKTLLEHYKAIQESVSSGLEHTAYIMSKTAYEQYMTAEESLKNQRREATARLTITNRLLLERLDKGLLQLKNSADPQAYQLLYDRYLSEEPMTVEQLLEAYHLDNDALVTAMSKAIKKLAGVLFTEGSEESFRETLELIRIFEEGSVPA